MVVAQVANKQSISTIGPLLAIIVMLWVFLLHASPSLFHMFPFGITLGQWRIISLVLLALVLAAEGYTYMNVGEASGGSAEEAEIKPGKRTIEYPPKITGVIYADTYVTLSDSRDVKVRTMLARTCPLCENKDDCWEKTKGKISEDDFASNMECMEGLRELGATV